MRLLSAGNTETACARLRIDKVIIRDEGETWVKVGGGRGRALRIIVLPAGSGDAIRELLATSSDGYLIPVDVKDEGLARVKTINRTLQRLMG